MESTGVFQCFWQDPKGVVGKFFLVLVGKVEWEAGAGLISLMFMFRKNIEKTTEKNRFIDHVLSCTLFVSDICTLTLS